MYSGYGFGNAGPPPYSSNSNNNASMQQPGAHPTHQQAMYNQQQQQQQQQQQFAGMGHQGGGFAPGPGGNPQMMPAPTHPGMMQHAGGPNMPNMTGNSQMPGFPQQFSGAPYGQVGQQNFAQNNYMLGAGMPGFPLNQTAMQQQQQIMQRMQPQHMNPAMSQASTPQRPPSAPQGTPNNALPSQHAQFATPQPPSQAQTPTNPQHSAAGQGTPQTPTSQHRQGAQAAGMSLITPLSPGSETRDKERFALLLDINHELLYESIQIQTMQQEMKKEGSDQAQPTDRKPLEEETLWQQDYLQCMRRLQANLTYMAAVADRKPDVKVPPCPAYLTAPPLNLTLRPRALPIASVGVDLPLDPIADRDQRDKSIRQLYDRLQIVFPGFDPKKEPAYGKQGGGQKPGNPGMTQSSPTVNKPGQITKVPLPPIPQSGMTS